MPDLCKNQKLTRIQSIPIIGHLCAEYVVPITSCKVSRLTSIDRSLVALPALGIPASLAFGYDPLMFLVDLPNLSQFRCCLHDLRGRRLRLKVHFSDNTLCIQNLYDSERHDLTIRYSKERL
jgi:hypothetical protein